MVVQRQNVTLGENRKKRQSTISRGCLQLWKWNIWRTLDRKKR